MSEIDRVQMLIDKGRAVLRTRRPSPPNVIGAPLLDPGAFSAWWSQSLAFVESSLPPVSAYAVNFRAVEKYRDVVAVERGIGILESFKEDLETGNIMSQPVTHKPMQLIGTLCERFHLVARQLRARHDNRPSLEIQDEYDVQDLMHSLLHLYFEDIRAEEWTPSYAGKCSRMDFLLKKEQIVMEIKKTRHGLGAKELGSQLVEDIARYESHPDCDFLLCFVYDPEGRIANPRGIENDLRRTEGGLRVQVWIRP